jgi:hypothetical protein
LLSLGLGLFSKAAWSTETSVSPYIDQLKAKMESEGKPTEEPARTSESPDPYIQSLRKKMNLPSEGGEPSTSNEPYIDHLKEKNPELNQKSDTEYSDYTEKMRAQLKPSEPGGAIEAVREGHSELHMKRPGHIRGGVGFKIGSAMNRTFSAGSDLQANSFTNIYGNSWRPDFNLIVEYKPFYSETFGSLGFIAMGGVAIYKASGRFAVQLTEPDNTTSFPMSSRTQMTFLSVPATIGAKYQFNLSYIIRPYAIVGPTLVGVEELRNDGYGAKKAVSKGLTTTAGAAILLDWMNADNTWNLYQDFSVKHYYLTVEYTKLTTVSSPVDVSYSGLTAGFQFDF